MPASACRPRVPSLSTWPDPAIVHDIKGENWQLTAGFRAKHGRALFDPTNQIRRVQSVARGAPRRLGGPRRPERRRRWSTGSSLDKRNHWEKTSPLVAGRCNPACPVLGGGQDARRRRRLPVRSEAADRDDTEGDDDDAASRRSRAASRGRVHGARALEQIRQRALRCALHRHVVSRPLSRSRRRPGDATLRLAHRRPDRRSASGDALPRGAAIRHLADQAAHPSCAEPDRPPSDGGPARQGAQASRTDDARRVPGARSPRLLRVRTRLHGGLWHQELFDRAVGTRSRRLTGPTTRSSTTAMSESASRPTTSGRRSASPMRWAPRPR